MIVLHNELKKMLKSHLSNNAFIVRMIPYAACQEDQFLFTKLFNKGPTDRCVGYITIYDLKLNLLGSFLKIP